MGNSMRSTYAYNTSNCATGCSWATETAVWKQRSNLSISLDVAHYVFKNKAGNMLNNTQNLHRF